MNRRNLLKALGVGSISIAAGIWTTLRLRKPLIESLLYTESIYAFDVSFLLTQHYVATMKARGEVEVFIADALRDSLAGIVALDNGAVDFAITCRNPKYDANEDDPAYASFLLAMDAVALVVAPANPVRAITSEQAYGLLTGAITNWSEVMESTSKPVTVIVGRGKKPYEDKYAESIWQRVPTRLNSRVLKEIILKGGRPTKSAVIVENAVDMMQKVATNAGAIGILSIKGLNREAAAGEVVPLIIDDVAMTPATVYSGRYPFIQSFYCVADTSKNINKATLRFIEFAQSDTAQDYIGSLFLRAN